MRTLILLTLALSLTGCASFDKRFAKLERGMTREQVTEILDTTPDHREWDKDGRELNGWELADAKSCGVLYGKDGKLSDMRCSIDYERRAQMEAQRASIAQAYFHARSMQQQAQQPPSHNYQPTQPVKTTCRSRPSQDGMGGYVTDCSSKQTGLDMSVWDR
jgi:hypothetical protein